MAELEIDKSNLPRVLDVCHSFAVLEDGALAHNLQEQEIEHFYNSNVQKNQLVQHDVRIARRLQHEEEERGHPNPNPKPIPTAIPIAIKPRRREEQDFEYATRVQEEILRQAEETRRREEEDEEMAKRLQEEEALEIRRQRAEAGCLEDAPLSEGLISLQLEVLRQVQRDAELARRLQEEDTEEVEEEEEEEERDRDTQRRGSQPPDSPQTEGPDINFRAAQVAQDEEIAHYMQRHQRKGHRRPRDPSDRQSRSLELSSEDRETPDRKVVPLQLPRERLNSQGLHSPGEEGSPEHQTSIPCYTMLQTQPIRNIAEELDPTFQARKRDSQLMANAASPDIFLVNRTPHSVYYDYLPEPAFIPPTKRQSDKSGGRHKAKDKRENCKQQ
ncbi:coiled-coil domain-containing protein 50 [Engraulis encrasicolus]|uniref:coiled-coil domain-containing protein 50 n=1 Tax=Engraulis encrasicolus TaxID=184585 RepID=UPI002FD094BF